MATRKWTKQQRAEASEKAKIAHARRKRDYRSSGAASTTYVSGGNDANNGSLATIPSARKKLDALAISGGTASTTYTSGNQAMAIDVVRLIGHDVPADVIVKVVERILR